MQRVTLLALVFAGFCSASVQASIYNVNDAFVANEAGSETNPNGSYFYGYMLGGSFDTSAFSHSNTWAGYGGLQGFCVNNPEIVPAVIGNVTSSPITTFFGVTLQANELLLHPGGIGGSAYDPPFYAAVVRYIVATDGDYRISGLFDDLHTGQTDIHVAINGTDVYSGLDAGAFDVTAQLQSGDTIDFIVGQSVDGIGADSTGLFANIEAVPEPATLTLFGLGALAVAAAAHRRRKRGVGNPQVKAAVAEYLATCTMEGGSPFRMLGKRLSELAAAPGWGKQEIDEFYDEVLLAIHTQELQEQGMERAS